MKNLELIEEVINARFNKFLEKHSDDMFQEGYLALFKSIASYNEVHPLIEFKDYAERKITLEITRYLLDIAYERIDLATIPTEFNSNTELTINQSVQLSRLLYV